MKHQNADRPAPVEPLPGDVVSVPLLRDATLEGCCDERGRWQFVIWHDCTPLSLDAYTSGSSATN